MKILIVGFVLTVLTVMIHTVGATLAISCSAPRWKTRGRRSTDTAKAMALLVVALQCRTRHRASDRVLSRNVSDP